MTRHTAPTRLDGMNTASTARRVTIGVVVILGAAACSDAAESSNTTPATLAPPSFGETVEVPPLPPLDDARVAAGEALYQQHCASCHKTDLSGEPGWQIPNDDGTLKPQPHDSTGHTWHHDDQLLLETIRDGSVNPISVMPTFGGILSDEEILDILEFFKSQWGEFERGIQWQVTWQKEQASR